MVTKAPVMSATLETQLSVEAVSQPGDLDELREEWNRLLWNNSTQTVELTFEWQSTYWKHFSRDSKLFVLVARESDGIVGIAPLKITRTKRNGFTTRVLEFIAASESNYQDFIIDPDRRDVLPMMFEYIRESGDLWDLIYLRHIPASSPTFDYLSSLQVKESYICKIEKIKKCIYLHIDSPWEEYEQTISSKMKWKIRNRTKKLAKLGELRSFHCDTEDEFAENLEKLFELHRKRWNQTETPSHFNNTRNREFYQDVIPELFPGKEIDLYVLNCGDDPVAMLYSFQHARRSLIQLVVYNTDYERYSPSTIMNHRFVEESFNNGFEMLDFGDYYRYKETWAKELKEKISLELYPRKALRSCLLYYLARFADPIREGLKKIGPLRRFVIRMKNR